MSKPSRAHVVIAILVAIITAEIIVGVMLIPVEVSAVRSTSPTSQTASAVAPTDSAALAQARAIVARVRDEIIPREGLATIYGVTFSEAGYQTLTQWNDEFKAKTRIAEGFEALDLMLPCCDWSHPSRKEESNCACGHHQALEGLAKKLLTDGGSTAFVQSEVKRWSRYLFPKEALAAELAQRAQFDPEIKAAIEELQAHGQC